MNTSILTIDPGTRTWGVSVFHGRICIVSFVKKLSTKASPGSRLPMVRKVFRSLCEKHVPRVLVLVKPRDSWTRQSSYLSKIIGEIKNLARKEHMKVVEFSPGEMRAVLCQEERATKKELAESIGRLSPELKGYLIGWQGSESLRWGKIVNSVGLGMCYLKMIPGMFLG